MAASMMRSREILRDMWATPDVDYVSLPCDRRQRGGVDTHRKVGADMDAVRHQGLEPRTQ